MKYLKSFNESKFNIEECINGTYTINPDGSYDVIGNVNLYKRGLTKIPFKFNMVTGYFNCSYNNLTSLEGCPKEVGGYFYCSNNNLTSLEGCPREVGGDFYCGNNNLFDLYDVNKFKTLDCRNNPVEEIYKLHPCEDFVEEFNNNRPVRYLDKPTLYLRLLQVALRDSGSNKIITADMFKKYIVKP